MRDSRPNGAPREVVPQAVLLSAAGTAVLVGVVTILRHEFFMSTTFDMAFYIQDVYQIAHGVWSNSIFSFHVFADHFSPLMILMAPLGYSHTAEGLLIIQALATGSGVVAAFRIGRSLGSHRIGVLCGMWWALSASVWHTVMYDFRPSNLGVVALLWLIAELEGAGRWPRIAAFTLIAAASREDMALFAGVALLIYTVAARRRPGLALLGSGSIFLGVWYTMWGVHLFAPFGYYMWYRYADYGVSPIAALGNPGYAVPTALQRLVRPEPMVAIAALLLPLLVVAPFLSWRYAWPGFLVVLSNAVTADPFIPTIYYQYYIAAVPFFIWAGAHAFRRPWLSRRVPQATVATILVWLVVGPIGLTLKPTWGRSFLDIATNSERHAMAQSLNSILSGASVSAGLFLLPHLSERKQAYSYPAPMVCSPSILAYHEFTSYPDYVVVEPTDRTDYPVDLPALGYRVINVADGVEIWAGMGDVHPVAQRCPSPEETWQKGFQLVPQRMADGGVH